MGLLNSIIKTFVGDKTKKDLKKISPFVDKINQYQKDFKTLNHDKLRKKTEEFKSRLFDKNKMLFDEVDLLNKKVDTTDDIDEKESLYKEIDKLNEDIQKNISIFLNIFIYFIDFSIKTLFFINIVCGFYLFIK